MALGTLWFAVFGAPLAWSLQELYSYAAMSHGCYPRRFPLAVLSDARWYWSSLGVSILAFLLGAASLTVGVRVWRLTREEKAGRHTETLEIGEGRTRFMAMSGIMLSAFFLIAIVLTGGALVGLPACGR